MTKRKKAQNNDGDAFNNFIKEFPRIHGRGSKDFNEDNIQECDWIKISTNLRATDIAAIALCYENKIAAYRTFYSWLKAVSASQ